MGKRTPFYELHLKAQAKIVDFSGWDMPLHYGSQLQEHHQVRQQAGVFDVSHMGVVDLKGSEVTNFLRYLLANNVDRLVDGKALYTCILNENGGIVDDLIVYKISEHFYRLVINAGTREKDLAWIHKQAVQFDVQIKERSDLAMLAIQGPTALKKLTNFFSLHQIELVRTLKPFMFTMVDDIFIARTGYTGEDGFELIFPEAEAIRLWSIFISLGILPCGLGARDTLRLEAGLNLYGADMDEIVTPLQSNLAWTVALEPKDRQFIGRQAIETQLQHGVKSYLVGLVLEGVGIMRNHQKIFIDDSEIGEITSGGYSPTLEKSIALARIAGKPPETCYVEIRQKKVPAKIIKPPFIKHGKKMF